MVVRSTVIAIAFLAIAALYAQQTTGRPQPSGALPLSVAGKWHNFVAETLSPLTLGAGIFNGGLSHLTNSDPRYGTNSEAFAERFGVDG